MAAANKPPCTPVRFTRQTAAMPSPGGRPPPKERLSLPPKNNSKANPKPKAMSSAIQLQSQLNISGSETTNTEPTTTTSPPFSAPVANSVPSPTKYTRKSAAMSSPGANPMLNPSTVYIPSAAMSAPAPNIEHTTARPTPPSQQPTPTASVNQVGHADTSPGGLSSRQSNDITDLPDQLDAATSEGHTTEGEPAGDLVPSNQNVF